jgi:HAD superfamily hydrolase (TIGR01509 family)
LRAVLLDIDGTLVDSNYLHIVAWTRAFGEAGLTIPAAEIHQRVGMGAARFVRELVGEDRPELVEGHGRHFSPLKPELRALPGAADLLREVHGRGATVVLASSSKEEDVQALLDAIDAPDAIDAVTHAGDVEEAKPDPEVFEAALAKAGCAAAESIVVGDTVWDVEAATRAGVRCVGVRSGGISEAELRAAGAVAVYRDAAHLLAELDAVWSLRPVGTAQP